MTEPKLLRVLTLMLQLQEALVLAVETRPDPYDLSPRMMDLREAVADLAKAE